MATTRLIPMHTNKGKTLLQTLTARTDYSQNDVKTEGGKYISTYECDPKTIDEEFLLTKRRYEQSTGRQQKRDIIAYQIRQSFKPGEVTPEEANEIGYELAMRFTKGQHAFIVATHFNELSDFIKASEARLAEIAALKKYILNYARTKDGYTQYRRSGYSEKFQEEHREEISLHKAAKTAFDALNSDQTDETGRAKLPTIRQLNQKYAQLLVDKKKAYAEYRSARKEMQDLLIARKNVETILGLDQNKAEQKKEERTR